MRRRLTVLDGTLAAMLVLLGVLALLTHARGGTAALGDGLGEGAQLLMRYAPLLVVSFLAAGLAEALVPHEWVRATLGDESGLRGIAIGAAAGVMTPAGPFISMPIAASMVRSGAGAGAVVAFVTGWSLLALHRFVAWEIPILGWRVAALRYGVCLVLPVIAGLAARALARNGV